MLIRSKEWIVRVVAGCLQDLTRLMALGILSFIPYEDKQIVEVRRQKAVSSQTKTVTNN